VEQHGLSLPKTDTNTKVNTTSDISPITATDAKTASDSDIEHKLGNKKTSNTNTDSQQTLDLPHVIIVITIYRWLLCQFFTL
jgi:hypothetical protein